MIRWINDTTLLYDMIPDLIKKFFNLVSFSMVTDNWSTIFSKFGCRRLQGFQLSSGYINCGAFSWFDFVISELTAKILSNKFTNFPCSASALAHPLPIPLDAPVTKHTLPTNDIILKISILEDL